MDIQTGYLINKNYVGRSQFTRNFSILITIIAIIYMGLWYFEPNNAFVNAPNCLKNIVFADSPKNVRTDSIEGMYVAHSDWKFEGVVVKAFLPPDTYLLRFDASGQVMYAGVKDYGRLNWRKTLYWFDWDSTDETIMRGEYKIDGKLITFTTTTQGVSRRAIDWNGRIALDDATQQPILFLTGVSASTMIFKFYNVGECPFGNE